MTTKNGEPDPAGVPMTRGEEVRAWALGISCVAMIFGLCLMVGLLTGADERRSTTNDVKCVMGICYTS